ncbi:MAG: cyclic nucleotide-binding domain-containing protein, partial [Desulfobacterales bacterium]|nr:cyclic nucleotide-binding domain-containing protein [Desulfobacterales bacterium]
MAKDLKTNLLNDQIINVIRKFMIFADLSTGEIRKLLSLESEYESRIAKLCSYKAGETVIKEGDFDCWSFWVVKGSYNVIQNGELVVNFAKPGEIFGEMSVLEGIPRTASVVSVTKGVCLCIDMSVIENLKDDHIAETIKTGFYNVILNRLERTKDKML